MNPINVGLIGIGTVGGGTWNVLKRNADEIARRAGRPIRITAVADKNVELAKEITAGAARVTDDAFSLVNDPEMMVSEVMAIRRLTDRVRSSVAKLIAPMMATRPS